MPFCGAEAALLTQRTSLFFRRYEFPGPGLVPKHYPRFVTSEPTELVSIDNVLTTFFRRTRARFARALTRRKIRASLDFVIPLASSAHR